VRFERPGRGLFIAFLLGAASFGCSSRQRNEDFIPDEKTARRALEAFLAAWQQGNRDQSVPGAKPGIMSGDSVHLAGRALKEFSILGPVAADADRCFAVNLVLDGPREEKRERYVVIGKDPLWVMRYDDYEMIIHWDHAMPTGAKSTAPAKPSGN
jgi:hypothetical protein